VFLGEKGHKFKAWGKGSDKPFAVVEEKVRKLLYPLPLEEEKGVSPKDALAELFNNQGL
jgi:hypothetical protein